MVNSVKWVRLNGWNVHASRFVDPPTWTWDPVPGIAHYRVRFAPPRTPALSAKTTEPLFSMAPMWKDLPDDQIDLVVEGFDKAGREACMPSWPKRFFKVPGFDGIRQEPLDWSAAACRNIAYLLEPARDADQPYERGWPRSSWSSFEDTVTGQRFRLAYPASNHPSFPMAFLYFAAVLPDEPQSAEARRQARLYRDWLFKHRLPGDWVCGDFPYSTAEDGCAGGGKEGNSITLFRSAMVGEAMIDLWEAFGDERCFEYAKHLGQVLLRLQRADGSWPYRVSPRDGAVVQEYTSDMIGPARLLAKLEAIDPDPAYGDARRRAIGWMLDNPVRTRHWQGQFEDFGENAPYENLEHLDADELVRYLVWFRDEIPDALDIALDVHRWVEDQFVVWQPENSPVPVECVTPGVLEQYLCYWPMESYNAYLIMSLMSLHQATGDPAHLDKAVALANAIVRSQYANGAFSTWGLDVRFGRPLRTDEWPGANAWASEALLRWDRYYRAVAAGKSPGRDLLKL